MKRYKILWQRDRSNKLLCKRMSLYNLIDDIVGDNDALPFLPPVNNSVILSDKEMASFLVKRHLQKKHVIATRVMSDSYTNVDYRRMYDKAWSIITVDMICPPAPNKLSGFSMGILTPLTVINTLSWDRTLEFLRK